MTKFSNVAAGLLMSALSAASQTALAAEAPSCGPNNQTTDVFRIDYREFFGFGQWGNLVPGTMFRFQGGGLAVGPVTFTDDTRTGVIDHMEDSTMYYRWVCKTTADGKSVYDNPDIPSARLPTLSGKPAVNSQ